MDSWFSALTFFEKFYWIIAVLGSGVFLILLVMTLMGGDVDDLGDVDADIDADTGIGFQLLSFKNLIGFFTLFGWSGIACLEGGLSTGLTLLISTICGLVMMTIMAALFYFLSKMQSSGTLKLDNAKDQIGEVYMNIGARRSTIGKVSINVQGGLRELSAITDGEVNLVQGNVVKVNEVTDNGILVVQLLDKKSE